MYYYKRVVDDTIVTVESYSHVKYVEDAEPCTKKEFCDFINALPKQKITNHKEEINKLTSGDGKIDYIINYLFK